VCARAYSSGHVTGLGIGAGRGPRWTAPPHTGNPAPPISPTARCAAIAKRAQIGEGLRNSKTQDGACRVQRIASRQQRTALGLLLLATAAAANGASAEGGPTPEEYVRQVGGDAQIVPVGKLTIDGHKVVCGTRPTVLDNTLDDYGAAFPGFLILNPKLLARIKSLPVKLWIHAHECGHQFRGPDEETADCFAVQRGRRQGWLTPEGLEDVCLFMAPAKADNVHFTGTQRCEAMKACYADRSIR